MKKEIMKKKDLNHSPQRELWRKLTVKQKAETAAVLRHLKKLSQIELCYVLLDYIEDGVIPEFAEEDFMLSAAFVFLTGFELEQKHTWQIQPIINL